MLTFIATAALYSVLLHLPTYVMLRCCTFSCTSSHTSCYAAACLFALTCIRHATLLYILLHILTHVMLRCCTFSCTSAHASCYVAAGSLALPRLLPAHKLGWGGVGWDVNVHRDRSLIQRSLAVPHIRHATLLHVLLHLLTYVMLRCCTFSCTCSHTSCYAAACSLALANIRHATLLYVLLHFLTHVMLRCCTFSCTSAHTSCYVAAGSLALPGILPAHKLGWGWVGWGGMLTFIATAALYSVLLQFLTYVMLIHAMLLYVLLHFLTHVMLRCCTFSCTSAHTSCYVAAGSLALPGILPAHKLGWGWVGWDANVHRDRSLIQRSLAVPHIRHAMLLHVLLHFLTHVMLRCCTFSCRSSHKSCYASTMASTC